MLNAHTKKSLETYRMHLVNDYYINGLYLFWDTLYTLYIHIMSINHNIKNSSNITSVLENHVDVLSIFNITNNI